MTRTLWIMQGVAFGLLIALSAGPLPAQQTGPHVGVFQSIATDHEFRIAVFRHMDTIFPSRLIGRGAEISELPRAERPLHATYLWKGHRRPFDDILKRTNTTGLLVIKDGEIAFEKYYLGADQKSRFTSMSMAKSFTSTLVGLALADGKIGSVDEQITDYIPELKGSGYEGARIKDILQMSSGVDFSEDYGGRDDLSLMWVSCMEDYKQSLADYARAIKHKETPGERFYYRSLDTQILGWLVQRVTGEHLADYLSRKIWQPLGAEQDATWLVDGTGTEAAFCCIQSTLRDYGRFGMMVLNHGAWNGQQIVPAGWVDEATTPGSPQVQPGHLLPNSPQGYQYQWWTFPGGADHAFAAEGVFFQYIYVRPRDNLVIVKTGANDEFWDDAKEPEIYAAFDAIAASLRARTAHR